MENTEEKKEEFLEGERFTEHKTPLKNHEPEEFESLTESEIKKQEQHEKEFTDGFLHEKEFTDGFLHEIKFLEISFLNSNKISISIIVKEVSTDAIYFNCFDINGNSQEENKIVAYYCQDPRFYEALKSTNPGTVVLFEYTGHKDKYLFYTSNLIQ